MRAEDSPIHLLVVSRSLDDGGAERFASVLLTHLDRSRVRPELVLLRDEVSYSLPSDIPVHRLGYRGIGSLLGTVRRLRVLLKQRTPCVVLSNITATNLVTGFALSNNTVQTRWIARVGDNPGQHDSYLRTWASRQVYPLADVIVANSRGLASQLHQRFPRLVHRVLSIGNPTDLTELDRQAAQFPGTVRTGGHPLLIAVGRLAKVKRYDVMINAFAEVREIVNAELWICGKGPERARLESQIRRLNLDSSVKLLGFCGNPHAIMAQADLFLLSSDHEGLPNALIEAQALGLPAVATRCPHGPDEIVSDGETGLLVPVNDPSAMADAITTLLASQEKRNTMRHAARELAILRFDAERLASKWCDLIVEVADGIDSQKLAMWQSAVSS